MDLGIAGKVAFVAGGSKGMGKSSGRLLADAGCLVGIVAQSWDAIHEAVAEIEVSGGRAVGVSADLTNEEQIRRAVGEVTEAFGSAPEIVVSQTNDMQLGNFDDTEDADFARCFDTFTMAQVRLLRVVLPEMKKKKWGRIVHIGSVCAKEADFGVPHILHNTARPSSLAFLRTIANEVAPFGITVNCVGPGWIATPTLSAYLRNQLGIAPEGADAWIEGTGEVPMNRLGTANEIGSAVAFFASVGAAYITGEFVAVDGGRHRYTF